TGLTAKAYSLKAKALYGTGQESAAKAFNVTALVTPAITSVKDPQGTEIPNGTTTTATTVTLSGKASNNQLVEIFDGATSKGTSRANGIGDWSLQVTGLALTAHSFTAKAKYGAEPVSDARTFTVILPIDHYTPFTNGDMNGWQTGGGVSIRTEPGNYYCHLYYSSGAPTPQIFVNLPFTLGRYELTLRVRGLVGVVGGLAGLTLAVDGSTHNNFTLYANNQPYWMDIIKEFDVTVPIRSLYLRGGGAVDIDDIRIRQI
ncbi:hypothetical protein HU806_06280, partial [Pseudomonas sp. SWRI154]|nr:hypothetical protein [Pseudomonas sp. SWRI154]